ncbi:MAG: D-tyrosyl-tRNA(Tyr) deacylase [Candidatus Cloacimonetes bacterium]|nr:D-tyrosyl-tRNA(Tyr) deacylase [Candidatus Cloacimonadota bacterium]
MKIIVQRVKSAQVEVDYKLISRIDQGLLIFLGIAKTDTGKEIEWLAKKISELRIFEDDQGKMNRCIKEINGEILLVSQFTLYADCRKGRRPGFDAAALPDKAERMYREFRDTLLNNEIIVKTGIFAADMQVSLINDGPVTIILER